MYVTLSGCSLSIKPCMIHCKQLFLTTLPPLCIFKKYIVHRWWLKVSVVCGIVTRLQIEGINKTYIGYEIYPIDTERKKIHRWHVNRNLSNSYCCIWYVRVCDTVTLFREGHKDSSRIRLNTMDLDSAHGVICTMLSISPSIVIETISRAGILGPSERTKA